MNYYQAGGPLFVLLGGEGPASTSWLSNPTAIMTFAKHFNAAVVQLEHRYVHVACNTFHRLQLSWLLALSNSVIVYLVVKPACFSFYGQSQPFPDLSVESLRFLTSRQVSDQA